jgi:GTP-binding protein
VDIAGSEGRDPIEDFEKINNELSLYSHQLTLKPQIVAANKMDLLPEDSPEYTRFKNHVEGKGLLCFPMSAPLGEGVKELITAVVEALKEIEAQEEPPAEIVEFDVDVEDIDPDYKNIYAEKDGETYILKGSQLKKIFDSTNFSDIGSLRYLYQYVAKRGGIDDLKALGLEEGDTIRIEDFEFEYIDEE